jgi:hypothetical protein
MSEMMGHPQASADEPRRSFLRSSAAWLSGFSGLAASGNASANTSANTNGNASAVVRAFSFALIGDVPYSTLDIDRTRAVLAAIEPSCRFIIHVGDFKASSDPCTNALLDERIDLLRASALPLVFVPGDNDWSDCLKPDAGARRPFERLDYLRQHLFQEPRSIGVQAISLERQSASNPEHPVPENVRWVSDGVMFVTLNRPGGVDLRKFTNLESQTLSELYLANERWLRASFALAQQRGIKLMTVAAHANPYFENDRRSWRSRSKRDPHAKFRRLLGDLALSFNGQILFLHGDTHWFQTNQPLIDRYGDEVPNFTRVECFGTPFSSSWVQIRVTPNSAPQFNISTHHLDLSKRP